MADLREEYSVQYDEAGSIGRRYRRQDEAGTPFCVTVDFDGVEADGPDTVTVRRRDDMSQERIAADRVSDYIRGHLKNWTPSLTKFSLQRSTDAPTRCARGSLNRK